MDFGKLESIDGIDLTLPPDHPATNVFFAGLPAQNAIPPELYVGGVQWGCKNWVGKVYPKGTRDRDFLAQYVRQFNTIELNTLFHHLQPPEVIAKWTSLAGPGFLFCPKFTGDITHRLQLRNAGKETALFLDHTRHLGSHLGHSFMQLSEGFGPDRAGVLQSYLRDLPRDVTACVELRHNDWFRNSSGRSVKPGPSSMPSFTSAAVEDTWALFHELGIGAVITDTAGRRDCLHMRLTAPVAFIRFVANGHPTDRPRIDEWAGRLGAWVQKGLKRIYFFVHSPEEFYSPELCHYAIGEFNRTCGTHVKPPQLSDDKPASNLTLF